MNSIRQKIDLNMYILPDIEKVNGLARFNNTATLMTEAVPTLVIQARDGSALIETAEPVPAITPFMNNQQQVNSRSTSGLFGNDVAFISTGSEPVTETEIVSVSIATVAETDAKSVETATVVETDVKSVVTTTQVVSASAVTIAKVSESSIPATAK